MFPNPLSSKKLISLPEHKTPSSDSERLISRVVTSRRSEPRSLGHETGCSVAVLGLQGEGGLSCCEGEELGVGDLPFWRMREMLLAIISLRRKGECYFS